MGSKTHRVRLRLVLLALILFFSLGNGAKDVSSDVVPSSSPPAEKKLIVLKVCVWEYTVIFEDIQEEEDQDYIYGDDDNDDDDNDDDDNDDDDNDDDDNDDDDNDDHDDDDDDDDVEEEAEEEEKDKRDDSEVEMVAQPRVLDRKDAFLKSEDEKENSFIDGRVAPSTSPNVNGQPHVISENRLRTIRSRFLYPFYDHGGDENFGDYQREIHSSTPQLQKNLNFQLPFFGFRFNYTRVSMHGYLEFSDPPSRYTYPLVFPVKDWPAKNDPSFIGIFYSKCRIGSVRTEDIDQRKPGVYFRMEKNLQERTDQAGVEMRERLTWDIRNGMVGASDFKPKHSAIVTWKNMSFAGGINNALFKTNTFQMVLATDEVYTYAIYNYADLQWASHTESGGDTSQGEGGIPAFVGFNAGNGTRSFEYYPYSQSSMIKKLTERGYTNQMPGRHIFRIDENILLGSCNMDIVGSNLPLVFAPESGNMLGGTIVNITGPCFSKTDHITCRFDTEYVVGFVVDTNRAICVQPPLMAEGYVRFEVAINTENYKWKGKFFIETPATATERIIIETNNIYEKSPAQIKISWNAYNLTTNLNAGVRISVWGYRETNFKPELQFIDILEEGVQNKGEYTIVPDNYRLKENNLTNDMQLGFIQINITDDDSSISPVFWSKPIPLGWYFGPQWERSHGSEWPEKMCNNWLSSDRTFKNLAADHSPCPCTLELALHDKGRFLPDFDCHKDTNPMCYYQEGYAYCVRSVYPSLGGSGQQCCYDKIISSYLKSSYDQQWASKLHRSDNLGSLAWNEVSVVPTLSYWYHDQIPYFQCCHWQEEQAIGCETYRFEHRPSQDCVAYEPPGVGGVFDDSNIVTFDNQKYKFDAIGEFVLARSDIPDLKLDIQGRFELIPISAYGQILTQLTSVAATVNGSTIIEVRLRPHLAQWRYRLDVLADGKRIYFDRNPFKIQHFRGVTVYTPSNILNQSTVIMMFQSGVGVEVVENLGFMTTTVYLPQTYINKTLGLLGNWSGNAQNDFIRPDGTRINPNKLESVREDIGKHWSLSDRNENGKGAALFLREFGRTASYYNKPNFNPLYPKELAENMSPHTKQI